MEHCLHFCKNKLNNTTQQQIVIDAWCLPCFWAAGPDCGTSGGPGLDRPGAAPAGWAGAKHGPRLCLPPCTTGTAATAQTRTAAENNHLISGFGLLFFVTYEWIWNRRVLPTWTGRRILDVTLLPDSASSWISRSSQLVAVVKNSPADSACNAVPNVSSRTCHINKNQQMLWHGTFL